VWIKSGILPHSLWLSLPRSVCLHGVVAIPYPQMSCFGVFTIIWTMRRFEMLVMGRPNYVGCKNWAHLGKWEIFFVDVTKKQHSRHTVLHFVIIRWPKVQYSLLLSVQILPCNFKDPYYTYIYFHRAGVVRMFLVPKYHRNSSTSPQKKNTQKKRLET